MNQVLERQAWNMSKQIHLSLFSQPVVSLLTSKTVFTEYKIKNVLKQNP